MVVRSVQRMPGHILLEGGSSAGAMVLCEHYYDPDSQSVQPGLNLLAAVCVIPHHIVFGKGWSARSTVLELIQQISAISVNAAR